MSADEPATPIHACLHRLAAGDPAARADLARLARDRLLVMTRAMLARYPGVRRWEGSDDVVQNVLLRLDRSLAQLRPETTHAFLSLAAVNIRRELIDLARHYYGPEGPGSHHATPAESAGDRAGPEPAAGTARDDPASLAEWAELHERIADLPADERAVVDLHWYHGMTHSEAAAALGVSPKTVKRRWVAAKVRLGELLGYESPV